TGDLNGIADDVIGLWLLNVDAHDDSCCQARGVPSSPDRDRSDVCGHHLVPPPWLVTPKRRSRTHVMIKLSSHEIQGASIGLRPHWKLLAVVQGGVSACLNGLRRAPRHRT